MTEIRQYDERDAMQIDINGGHYSRHVAAMTAEMLHSKSDIAAELGWRDMQIAVLSERLQALAAENAQLIDLLGMGAMAAVDKAEFPATDAAIREIRTQGIHFVANRFLAVWEAGFIDDTAETAYDISGAILSTIEALPNAGDGEFIRDYADEVRALIRKGEIEQ